MTPESAAAELAEACTTARRQARLWEQKQPGFARALRRDHKARGTRNPFDHPTVTVPVEVAETLLGLPDPNEPTQPALFQHNGEKT